ncbi:hypothetical protein N7451_012450 [Penicillium sp. IBT 35674x]|nr:hypothetical protein N7451_012450 [Penicillium sp. IBT 35674x]
MSITWVDSDSRQTILLPRLIKSYIDPENPSTGIRGIFRLSELLLLSNHITEAHKIICAVYNLADTDKYFEKSYTPLVFEVFWHAHRGTLTRPTNARISERPETRVPREQWGKYRECTRTGWMLGHYDLAEPEEPSSVWRQRDDPAMLAMCARLLAKSLASGTYPPLERMREALEVAQKLYALPEPPYNRPRHAYLLHWRLPIELAIRLGELQTAADLMSQWLHIDGFKGFLWEYLIIPGIYDVVPLLGGKKRNPLFITKEDAQVMVQEITAALELRAREGRQWELAESRVSWRELLDRLTQGAWKTRPKEYRYLGAKSAEDILYDPATEAEIEAAENKVGELPADFKEMVRIANGFMGGHHLFGGGIAGIQYIRLSVEDEDQSAAESMAEGLGIKVSDGMITLEPGVECDGFSHYLVPPAVWKKRFGGESEIQNGEYCYCHWAPWTGGPMLWRSIRDYVADCVEEVEGMLEKGEKEEFYGDESEEDDSEEDDAEEDDSEEDDSEDEDVNEGDETGRDRC